MGNTDPNNTKQENKYEVKPQYKELSKQQIMQHAIINAMKCMRAIKDRRARPVYQLENHHNQPLYPHGVSTGEIIDSQGTAQPIEASQPSPATAITVETPWNSNLYQVSNNQLNLNSTSKVLRSSSIIQLPNPTEYFSTLKRGLNLARNHLPKSAQHPKNALPDFSRNHRTPAASRSIPQVVLQSLMGNNRKSKPQGVQRYPNRRKQRLELTEI
ncbi:scarecrow-like protein 14 [Dorcoceras hygrometricum]|uniref:Scarecrow-like protein 14 n=1 Tax=Dorcoceras hygrometricum TaxID=472368 RepID=A0A2Z7BGC5_9LAMI|nr:scarecrow-like protein 14 [Dorcoceras hygrometricum]